MGKIGREVFPPQLDNDDDDDGGKSGEEEDALRKSVFRNTITRAPSFFFLRPASRPVTTKKKKERRGKTQPSRGLGKGRKGEGDDGNRIIITPPETRQTRLSARGGGVVGVGVK
jgi:hypothetical protein